ncbi:hypothetical protein ACHAWX_004033 [Stephanocyclus meneghinianus]
MHDEHANIFSSPWPFDDLKSANSHEKIKTTKTTTGKYTGGVGDIIHAQQAWRKEVQLANLIHCVLALASKTYKIDRGSKHTI